MPLTMKQKHAVTKQLVLEYRRAGKKRKGEILDSVIQLTDYNRSYAARVLREWSRPRVLGRLKRGGVNPKFDSSRHIFASMTQQMP